MTKFNRTRFKKAMAAILAVAMIGQNCSYAVSAEDVMSTDAAVQEQAVQETEQQAVDVQPVEEAPQTENVEAPQTDSAEGVAEAPAETPTEAPVEVPTEAPAETPAEAPVEAPAVTQPEKSEEGIGAINNESSDANAENAQENAQPQEEAPTATWHVTFAGDAAVHGTIQVKGEAAPADVVSYNKEVKENEKFEFSIIAAQGYEVERVTLEANGAELGKNAEGFYEIPAVTKDEKVLVTYRELPQVPVSNTETPAAEEPAKNTEESSEGVRENEVDFITDGGAAVIVDGVDVTNGSAMAKDGTIVYTIIPNNDYEIVSILIDNDPNLPARFNETTEEANDYITEGISETTSVVITTKAIEPVEEETVKTEPAEEENETDAEIAMPELHYNGVCNNIVVNIYAPEGVFPEGTNVILAAPSAESIAAAAEAAGQEASSLTGVDITFEYDGKEIQPTSSVEVSFTAAEISAADISNIYHVTDDGAVQEVAASQSGESLGFTADSFSTWLFPTTGGNIAPASILEPETKIATYNFTVDGAVVDTQYITKGDTLLEPESPAKEGWKFVGWYIGTEPVTFGTITEEKDVTITVEARFEEVHYVFFHNPNGEVVATKEGITGDEIQTSDVTFSVGSEESITGWYTSDTYDEITKVNTITLAETNIDLYAKVEKGFWITYDSNGGTYVAPEFYLANQIATLSKSPTKNGYTFEGWYDGETRITSATTNVSVKAKWKENVTADYRVIYWQQKVTDDKNASDAQKTYEYVETKTYKGTTGKEITANDITVSYNGFAKNKNNSKSVTIAADGSTIMNVYYDRVLCTVNYYVYYESGWYGDWQIQKTVTGLYGANLKEGEWWTDYSWRSRRGGGNGCILLTSYDFKKAGYEDNEGNGSSNGVVTSCNFFSTNADNNRRVYYYNEQADGSFKLINTIDIDSSGNLTIYQKYAGYDLYKYTTGSPSGNPTTAGFWKNKQDCKSGNTTSARTVYIASKLQSFKLDYSNGGTVQHHETVKYTAPLNGYDVKFTPTRPDTVDANYTFDGWYSNPECTTKFDFNTTMPAANVIVYAGWKAPTVTVTAHTSLEDAGVQVDGIVYGGTVDENALPKITVTADQVFLGWFTRNSDGSFTPWNFAAKVHSDVDLYARVISKGTFQVTYDANGGSGTVTDNRKYVQGAKANVQKVNGITAPEGKAFLYWSLNENGSGTKYYPNDKIEIQASDITLYAIWGSAVTTTLTYNGNEGTTSDGKTEMVVSGLKNNQKVAAEGEIFTRNGYKFIGWSTNPGAASATYQAGGDVIVHADAAQNVLYAVWEIKKDYNYTVHYYWNGTEEKVAEDKAVTELEYGTSIEESPITIEGYTPVALDSQTIVLDAYDKEITFYYYKNVELTANGAITSYNGNDQSVNGFTGAPAGADFSAINVSASGKDAGTYPAEFAENTKGTVDGTGKYIVTDTTDGELVINPRAVVLTSESGSKPYDGTALMKPDVTVTGEGFVDGEVSDVKATGSALYVSDGEVTNTIVYTAGANFKENNYSIERDEGKLSITASTKKVVVTITGNKENKLYDGNEKVAKGYTASIDNALYTEADFKFSGNAEVNGKDADTYKMGLAANQFENANSNFANVEFSVTDGELVIKPRTVVLTSESGSKPYDGTALTKPVVTVTGDGFADGEVTDIKATGSVIYISDGEVTNTIVYTAGADFKDSNYSITKNEGKLIITESADEVVVTITGNKLTETYDGTEKTAKGYTVNINNGLYTEADFEFTGKAEVNGTDADTYKMGLTAAQFENKNGNFKKVTFVVTDGELVIDPRTVVLTSEGGSKPYDGTALTKPKVIVTEGFVAGEVTDIKATGSALYVSDGEVTNTIVYTAGADFKESNYSITKNEGKLSITASTEKVVVTIIGNKENELYDGTEKVAKGYTASIDNALYTEADFKFTGKAEVNGTDAGTYNMGLAANQFENANTNFANVEFSVTDGELVINPRTVVFTSESGSKSYDGTALTKSGVLVTGDGFVNEEGATYTVTGSQTLVGSSFNTFSYSLKDGTKKDNYIITKNEGILEVTDDSVDPNGVVTKTHENKQYGIGETITFDIVVKNIYAENKNIIISEIAGVTITGESRFENVAPGETVETTAAYTITEKDILEGTFTNTVTATFENGKSFENTDIVELDQSASLTIEKVTTNKESAENGKYALGQVIEYTITVANSGNMTIRDISVSDPLTGNTWRVESLAPGASKELTASYQVTEADILAGEVVNVATATGFKPDDSNVPEVSDSTTDQTADINGSLSVEKEAKLGDRAYKAGDTVEYTITVTNNGNVTISGITVTDEQTGLEETIATLAPNGVKTFVTSHVITENDILAGHFTNIAEANGKDPNGNDVDAEGEETVTTVDKNGHLTVTKKTTSAPKNAAYELGEAIEYEIVVKNDGNLTITNIVVTDELTGDTWTVGTLAPEESQKFTTKHVVTEADILTGKVQNEATAAGTSPDPENPEVPVTPGKTEDPTKTLNGSLFVTKEAKLKIDGYKAGDTVEYTITVTNNGNVTISDIVVTDEQTGFEGTIATLAPNGTKTFETSYVITENDILAGHFTNIAEATGKNPNGEDVEARGEETVTTAKKNGHLTVTKTSDVEENQKAVLGQTINYTITVINDGNLTITDIRVTDDLTDDEWTIASLAPGESKEFTTEYVVTESDILEGQVVNVATAQGTSPDPDEPEVPVTPGEKEDPTEDPNGHLTIDKETTNEPENEDAYVLGEAITYKITVTNDGNLTITDIAVTDDLTGDEWIMDALAPGESKEFTAEHVVTESDILEGQVVNVATATGTSPDPNEPEVPVTPGKTEDPIEDPNGHLTIDKETTSEPENEDAYALGETITYKITVTNDGNLTITDITVTDDLTGDEWTIDALAPEESEEFDAEYVVTEADILEGQVVNVATATGTSPDPDEPEVPVEPGEEEDPTEDPNGHLTIDKETTSEPENEDAYALGETITYKITVTNDGNLTITDITVTDDLTGDEWTIETLAPGEFRKFDAEYVVTEADILEGQVVNVATATGTSPDPDEPEVPVEPGKEEDPTDPKKGHLTIAKTTTSTPENGSSYALGETITYKITVTNDGNLTITDITVTDDLTGDEWTIDALAPGESEEFDAEYVVTEADILEGQVVNVATAKGTSPDPDEPNVPVEPGEKEDPTDPKNGHLTIAKTTTSTPENGSSYALGETITYKITVTNDGNLTITDITVTDDLTGDEWTIDALAPGESEEFDAEYVVTEADILEGKVVNVATAKGTSPDPDEPDVPVEPGEKEDPTDAKAPSLFVEKIAEQVHGGYRLGDEITYVIRVVNNGNVTLSDVTVVDEKTGLNVVFGTMKVGETKEVTTTYTVTEADIKDGKVDNVAVATGKDPEGEEITDNGKMTVKTEPVRNGILVTKVTTSTPANGEKYVLGETITYKIAATNTGNQTLTGIIVTDELTGDEWTIRTLAPGESEEFTAEYVVTEADILVGQVVNVATATATSPDPEDPDVPVEPGKTEDPTEDPNGHLTIAKTTTSIPKNGSSYALGETITYKITAKNDGNLTLTNVLVEDALTGNVEEKAWTIESLAPGASEEFTAEYVVTEADILAGKVVNVATAKGTSPDPEEPEVPVVPGEKEDPTETKAPFLFVEKTAEQKDGGYLLGDVITYTIRVVNNGNVTLSDVTVVDEKTGLKEMIGTMKVGETKEVTTTYTVTEADITAGKIDNVAIATGKDPEGAEVAGRSEKTVFTEHIRTGINIVKTTTSTPANGERYVLGEMITYKITATNTGNQTLTRITVTDELTGNIGDKAWKIDTLAPGESKDFEVQYEVKEEDRLSGIVTNIATATVEKTNPEDPDVPVTPGQKEDLIDPEIPDGFYYVHKIKITKNVVDANGNAKNSNETFYAGIFTDADFTTLATNVSQNIVPLEMAGGSETSAEVELSILKTESATIYIAEVDAEGNPVDYDENFAYDVSIDNEEITLDAENQNATVTIVNAEIEPEQVTPTPTQDEDDTTPTPAPEDKGTQKMGVKTGDDTPIDQFGFLLMCSVACIALIIGKRKKEKRS